MDEEQALHTSWDGAKPKRKTASSPSYSCCGNDLAIKSTAVRLSIVNKNFDYVTFAKEAFENLVDFRIKAIKEEAFDEIIVPLKGQRQANSCEFLITFRNLFLSF